jgi:hypothetical protein
MQIFPPIKIDMNYNKKNIRRMYRESIKTGGNLNVGN